MSSGIVDSIEALRAMIPNTAAEALEIEIVSVDTDQIQLRMPITNRARQPMGLLHGGVSMVLAETAASVHACWGIDLSNVFPVGIEINGSHLRSASEGHVIAKATVIRRSRTLILHAIEITHEETNRLLCAGRVTNFYRPAHP
jgi:1,4-dihydroxy-2-naphthoyl-CoA hydrolase